MSIRKKLYVIFGSITVVLIVANVIMNVVTDNKIIAAQNDGNSEGQTQGYTDGYNGGNTIGYKEGNTIGYKEGNDKGYIEGDTEGYETGLTTGNDEGEIIGFVTGEKDGYQEGWKSGYQPSKTQGYNSGYSTGYTEVIDSDFLVHNVTYVRIMKMLDNSNVKTAEQLNNEFEDAGIRSGYVWVKYARGGGYGIALVAFDTIDKGIIFVKPWSHQIVYPEIGEDIFESLNIPPEDFDGTITNITISW